MNSIKERNKIGYEIKDEQTYFEQTQEIEHVGICDYTNIIVYTKSKRCFIQQFHETEIQYFLKFLEKRQTINIANMSGVKHRGLDSCEFWRELPYDEMRGE
jgi:CMP-2-keto-3-deoxyoctulosonic acid synthetase